MSGLSDVRLVLRTQELAAEQARKVQTCDAPRGLSRWALFWLRRRTRKTLLELTPEQLRDIGLSAEQARHEGLKPFWRS
ncbi:MAG: hypothetical protein GAK37_01805 [Pseudomonas sp.]|nr:MAG: hypothetical protein GAK37_01805 [Pseudomonas sp.]